jgi:hypothetical protein
MQKGLRCTADHFTCTKAHAALSCAGAGVSGLSAEEGPLGSPLLNLRCRHRPLEKYGVGSSHLQAYSKDALTKLSTCRVPIVR